MRFCVRIVSKGAKTVFVRRKGSHTDGAQSIKRATRNLGPEESASSVLAAAAAASSSRALAQREDPAKFHFICAEANERTDVPNRRGRSGQRQLRGRLYEETCFCAFKTSREQQYSFSTIF